MDERRRRHRLRLIQARHDVCRDIHRGIRPRQEAGVFVEYEQKAAFFRHGVKRRTKLREERVLEVALNAEKLRLRVLDEALGVDLKPFDVEFALTTGGIAK